MIELALALRARAPRGQRRHHRAPHDGATRVPADGARRSGWTPAVLDRIDEIVAPGTNVNREDAGWTPSVLANSRLRRRHYR